MNRKQYMKLYQQNHKEELKIYNKKYMINYTKSHKKEKKEYMKIYCQTHKSQRRKYTKNKRKVDSNFKIRHYLSSRISNALKKNSKSESTLKLLGCSIDFLRKYLQKQFIKGMSWENYGKWHIDHIRPCASFDLSKPEEQRKCFHYTNLQPLWAQENLIKCAKILNNEV